MKRIYVLQYPDGTFWDGWEKHSDPCGLSGMMTGKTLNRTTMNVAMV